MDETFTSLIGMKDHVTIVPVDGGDVYFSAKLKMRIDPPLQMRGIELVGKRDETELYLLQHDLLSGLCLVVESYFDHGRCRVPRQTLLEQAITTNPGLLDQLSPRFRPTIRNLVEDRVRSYFNLVRSYTRN
jgi:hypothetical protein